jgi:hypothetical protein
VICFPQGLLVGNFIPAFWIKRLHLGFPLSLSLLPAGGAGIGLQRIAQEAGAWA